MTYEVQNREATTVSFATELLKAMMANPSITPMSLDQQAYQQLSMVALGLSDQFLADAIEMCDRQGEGNEDSTVHPPH